MKSDTSDIIEIHLFSSVNSSFKCFRFLLLQLFTYEIWNIINRQELHRYNMSGACWQLCVANICEADVSSNINNSTDTAGSLCQSALQRPWAVLQDFFW